MDLPKVNSWIGVRVTAVVNPGHFWVQFPCGSGPIEKKIIEGTIGAHAVHTIEREMHPYVRISLRTIQPVKGLRRFRTHTHV